jgi:hypothetical protein
MNRFASVIALVIVVAVVSAMSASYSGTSLALATVLVAGGVLVHKFVLSVETAEAAVTQSNGFLGFAGHVMRNVLRFAIGAVVIAWMVVSVLWFVGA